MILFKILLPELLRIASTKSSKDIIYLNKEKNMKITRRQLRKIIRETLILEQNIGPMPGPAVATGGVGADSGELTHIDLWLADRGVTSKDKLPKSKLPKLTKSASSWLNKFYTSSKQGARAFDNMAEVLKLLSDLDEQKREANVKSFDHYFHFLGFSVSARWLKKQGWNAAAARSFLVDGFSLGHTKELFDYLNPLGSTTLNSEEWAKDMETNSQGVEWGLSGANPCDGARAYAKRKGHVTVGELLADPNRWPGWEDKYGDSVMRFRKFYQDDDIFVQPRYNCRLSKDDKSHDPES